MPTSVPCPFASFWCALTASKLDPKPLKRSLKEPLREVTSAKTKILDTKWLGHTCRMGFRHFGLAGSGPTMTAYRGDEMPITPVCWCTCQELRAKTQQSKAAWKTRKWQPKPEILRKRQLKPPDESKRYPRSPFHARFRLLCACSVRGTLK